MNPFEHRYRWKLRRHFDPTGTGKRPMSEPLDGWAARRWHCYMGRFPVPEWLYYHSPRWMHRAADWLGGVEPSPWRELWGRISASRPACFLYRLLKGGDRD